MNPALGFSWRRPLRRNSVYCIALGGMQPG